MTQRVESDSNLQNQPKAEIVIDKNDHLILVKDNPDGGRLTIDVTALGDYIDNFHGVEHDMKREGKIKHST